MNSSAFPDPVCRAVADALAHGPPATRCRVACSAGVDSVALAHALATVLGQGTAGPGLEVVGGQGAGLVHVDHGLQAHSAAWADAVRALGARLGLRVEVLQVAVGPTRGRGLEAAARQARYQALERTMQPGELLLSAHHLDDQAETVLLNLLRGAGPDGLAAMPLRRPFGRGWLVRPLISLPKDALVAHARAHDLVWHDDPSNAELDLRRNYLRHTIMPALELQWPGARRALVRAGALASEARDDLRELSRRDLAVAREGAHGTVAVDRLLTVGTGRAARALRTWLSECGLTTPSRASMQTLLDLSRRAGGKGQFAHAWPGGRVRYYQGRLFADGAHESPSPGTSARADRPAHGGAHPSADGALSAREASDALTQPWSPPEVVVWGGGRLWATSASGLGVSQGRLAKGKVELRARRGGERLRPKGRGVRKRLKALLQETRIPPWRRDAIPLVYVNGELAAVADLWVDEAWAARPGEPGWRIRWQRP